MNITSEILIILSVILINAIFVLSEMSIASSRKARLLSAQLINRKKPLIKKTERMQDNPEHHTRKALTPSRNVFGLTGLVAAILFCSHLTGTRYCPEGNDELLERDRYHRIANSA